LQRNKLLYLHMPLSVLLTVTLG